jgi:hypothetical protein
MHKTPIAQLQKIDPAKTNKQLQKFNKFSSESAWEHCSGIRAIFLLQLVLKYR